MRKSILFTSFFIVIVLMPNLSFGLQALSPYEQMVKGVLPENIVCPVGLAVMVKLSTNSPVCVKPDTMTNLIDRNWGANPINSNGTKTPLSFPYVANVPNTNFTINYVVTGATVTGITKDPKASMISISLQTQSDGSLSMEIPRKLLSSETHNINLCDIIIQENGQDVDFSETKKISIYRLTGIPFYQMDKKIDVYETCII